VQHQVGLSPQPERVRLRDGVDLQSFIVAGAAEPVRNRDIVRLCLLELHFTFGSEAEGILEVHQVGNGSLMGFGRQFGDSYAVLIGLAKHELDFRRKSSWKRLAALAVRKLLSLR